jgi:hypothetical protein
MCRNIRLLFNFTPPTTDEEIRAAALQYVRKVSGLREPSKANDAAFRRSTEAITKATRALLESLEPHGHPHTREEQIAKARARNLKRFGPKPSPA